MRQVEEVVSALEALKSERKFDAEALYPGAPNETVRARCEARVNQLLTTLIAEEPQSLASERVLSQFRIFLPAFDDEDTNEREQACIYCERIMDIVGIASSEGVLNTWLYGFDPNQAR